MNEASEKSNWFEHAAIYLEWLNPREGLDVPSYVEQLIRTSKALGADALAFCVDEGGRPLYDSQLAAKDGHIGSQDLIGMLLAQARANDLKFIAAFYGAQGNPYVSTEAHPDWCVVDAEGRKRSWFSLSLLCCNSPFGEYYARFIGEFLDKYKADGIYVEGIYMPTGYCYCQHCRKLYRERYGKDIPRIISPDDAEYQEYRLESASRAASRIRKVVDAVSPQTVFFWTVYYPRDGDFRSAAVYPDVVVMERQWGFYSEMVAGAPLIETGLHTRIAAAQSKKPVGETHHAHKQVDCDYTPRPAAHVKLTFWESAAHGAIVQTHVQNYYDIERCRLGDLQECFANLKRIRPHLINAERVAFAGLVDGVGGQGQEIPAELRGWHRALVERHVLYDIVAHEDLRLGKELLGKFKVVVLPNVMIGDDERSGLKEYVLAGGGLVVSGVSRVVGTEKENLLTELTGVKGGPGGLRKSPSPFGQWYWRVESAEPLWAELSGRWLSFKGDIIDCEPVSDAVEVVAQTYQFDPSRMHPHHTVIGWYPGDALGPLVTARRIGKGRVVYIAGNVGESLLKYGFEESFSLLENAMYYASNTNPFIHLDAPGTVEMTASINRRTQTIVVFLLNHSSNQYHDGNVIRFCVPIADVKVTFGAGCRIEDVSAIFCENVEIKRTSRSSSIRLSRLNEYEVLMVRYGALP